MYRFPAKYCSSCVEVRASYCEVGSVEFKRHVKLEPGKLYRSNNISCRVRLREHVLDLETAFDVPFRNIVIAEHLYSLRSKGLRSLTLSGILHDLECLFRFNAIVKQISHDTVSCTDNVRNGTCAGIDKILGISEPYVSTV